MNTTFDALVYWFGVWLMMSALFVLGGLGGAMAFRRLRGSSAERE